MKKQVFSLFSAALIVFSSVPSAFAVENNVPDLTNQGKTPDGSYDYRVWRDTDKGTISFDGDQINGGSFSCKWDDVDSCIFSKGHILDPLKKSYKEFGEISCDYSIDYSPNGSSWYGIEGWVENREKGYQQNKYAEFLIIDGYAEYRPWSDEESLGSITVDGTTYDMYRICRAAFDAPTYYQYCSVISEKDNKAKSDSRSAISSHISVSEHFAAWEKAGIDMSGSLYEVGFEVEGWQSSGEAKVLKNDLDISEKAEPVTKSGDVNGDDEFGISDVVVLKRWMLGAKNVEISDWKSGDMNNDDQLDVFDLCLMKKQLIKKTVTKYIEPDCPVEFGAPAHVVEKDGLEFYLGPDKSYSTIATIPDGTRLRELGYQNGNNKWMFTEYKDQYGWIRTVKDDDKTPTIYFDEVAKKPVIYLYPEQETDVHVELELTESELSTTYPRYNNGWDVTAYPDGTLLNKSDGTHHKYLFWDSTNCRTRFDFSKGFCVAGNDTESFLKEKLAYMGLTEEEMNEFIVYWLPLMEHNKYNLISFQGEAYTNSAKLDITPAPDSICRIFMTYVPLEDPVDIEPQPLESFERKGFTVVEWGGCEIKY